MLEGIISYIRSWIPVSTPYEYEFSRKRRASDVCANVGSPKYRKVLSNMSNNLEDDFFASPTRTMRQSFVSSSPTLVLDDDDDEGACQSSQTKMSKCRSSLYKHSKTNGSDDISFVGETKSMAEKKLDAKKAGFSSITRFTPNCEPVTTKFSTTTPNRTKLKPKISPLLRRSAENSIRHRPSLTKSFLSSSALDYSARLEEKKKYNQLLENVAINGSLNNSSIYGTPLGTLYNYDRSRKLVELARAPILKPMEVVDLTNESKGKLSTKDTVIKILDNFDNEEAVIDDSDSDVEILPRPPSPKPDIKVDPVNSLRTVINTSKHTQSRWLDDITKRHENYVENKQKEIQAYSENSLTLAELNRDLRIQNLSRKVKDTLAIREAILPVIEIAEEEELPELTSEHLKIIKRAFSGSPNEVLTKKFNLNVIRRDIETLAGLNWLNDNVINFYMNLIMERGERSDRFPRAYCTNTFFYQKLCTGGPESLKRWTRKIDIFSYEFVCVPIHLGVHWCMAIINLKDRTIKYYDSMGKPNNHCLNALREYLEFEHRDKKGSEFNTEDFILENAQNIPQQMNGSDCGMFSCTFAEFATRKAKFNFDQEDMPYLRRKMVVEIVTGQLLINQ